MTEAQVLTPVDNAWVPDLFAVGQPDARGYHWHYLLKVEGKAPIELKLRDEGGLTDAVLAAILQHRARAACKEFTSKKTWADARDGL